MTKSGLKIIWGVLWNSQFLTLTLVGRCQLFFYDMSVTFIISTHTLQCMYWCTVVCRCDRKKHVRTYIPHRGKNYVNLLRCTRAYILDLASTNFWWYIVLEVMFVFQKDDNNTFARYKLKIFYTCKNVFQKQKRKQNIRKQSHSQPLWSWQTLWIWGSRRNLENIWRL